MEILDRSDLRWLLQQSVEAFSWTGISWAVALLAGAWGVMVGIGAFPPAYILLGLCILLCAIKWGHTTSILTAGRRISAFVFGMLLLCGLGGGMVAWTHSRKLQTDEDVKKLEPLKQIPGLVSQVNEIPKMQKTISDLQSDNRTATEAASRKQSIIEGLAQTVIAQQKTIAENAHKDLAQATSALSTNINQYRSDTTSAVSKILRPPRTLGEMRSKFITVLKTVGPQDVAITPAHGSEEAINFATELESAFKEAGWNIVRTGKFVFMIRDGVGLGIVTKEGPGAEIKREDLTPGQAAVGQAFKAVGMEIFADGRQGGEVGPTELYVGLQ